MSDDGEQYFVGDRLVSDLKVVELRKELEIRSLPKSGNKKELVERLQNFLRDEKAEQTIGEQTQLAQQTVPTTELSQSPAVPNVVAQYLAQQQIQLQAARRSADKIRSGTSVDDLTAMVPISSPTNEEIQHTMDKQKNNENQGQSQKSTESVLEGANAISTVENESSIEKPRESEVSKDTDQQSAVETVKSFEEERTETEEKEGSEEESSSENEGEMKEEKEDDEQTEEQREEVEKSEDQTSDPREEKRSSQVEETPKKGENATEEEQEEGHVTIAEPMPEKTESEHGTESVVGKHKMDTSAEEMSGKSAKTRSAAGEEELDFENEEEEEEEREEPADDGGKRRLHIHQGSPVTMQNKLTMQKVAEDATGGISTSETVGEATRESEIGPVVAQLTALIKEESSKPPDGQQETTPEGFIRRRPSSPARNPPSRWIHIRNLKRPFTKAALFDLLGKFGTVDTSHFWMDSIKSTCIATYETEEQAQLARERLHNVVWPVASDLALCVEYSTEEKLKRRKAEEEREASANNSALGGGLGLTIVGRGVEPMAASGTTVLIQHDKERKKEAENRKRKVEELEKSQKTLDELFKKTKALPSIYFLPLSDEEATKRRKNLPDNKPQSQHGTSESHRISGGNSSRHRPSAGGGNARRNGGGGESGGRHRQSRR